MEKVSCFGRPANKIQNSADQLYGRMHMPLHLTISDNHHLLTKSIEKQNPPFGLKPSVNG